MSKNKTVNPDRPRVDPLGDLKIAESRGTIANPSKRYYPANEYILKCFAF
jgi:hypothetical protein